MTLDPAISLLCDLISVNSVNPGLVTGAPGEAAVAEVARAAMNAAGLETTIEMVLPGRPNVIGVLDGREPGPCIIFCGHLDTVGVQGMNDPFSPRIEQGRVYGRGSQDMKGGVAAMIAAAGLLAPAWKRGRLVVAGVIDEEFESAGADALVTHLKNDFLLAPGQQSAAIVTEPTDLQLAIAHKGFAWIEVTTRGRAAHGSRPNDGRDAILRMGRVLSALERRDRELQARAPLPLQGVASLHASIISGGREISVYPDQCVLQLERRTVAGEEGIVPLEEIEELLAELSREDPEFEASARLMTTRPPYGIEASHELPRALAAELTARARPATPTGMTFWTDAAVLASAGIPSVLFGPGGAGLHSVIEYVNADDVLACRDVLAATARRLADA